MARARHTEQTRPKEVTGEDRDVWENSFVDRYYRHRIVPHKDPKYDIHYDDKEEILMKIKEKAGDTISGKRPLNIAVIGFPGVGKSSFLNTVFASLNMDRWEQVAPHFNFGEGGLQGTTRFRSYQKEQYYRNKDNSLLPTFLDMTGFEDDCSTLNLALLELVFTGRIREEETLLAAKRFAEKHGANGLLKKYNKFVKHRPVDRIIVVCSSSTRTPLQTNLLEAIIKVSKTLRDIPVYGVLTCRDKYPPDTIQDRIKTFKNKLGLPNNRFAHMTNYCDEVDPEGYHHDACIPSLDYPVLKLMQQVLTPHSRDDGRKGTDWLVVFVFIVVVLACLFVLFI